MARPFAAAVAVAALAVGVLATHGGDGQARPAAAEDAGGGSIQNGDTVAASGKVLVAPDGAAQLCPPGGVTPGFTANDSCARGIPAVGVDPSKLAMRDEVGIYTVGQAYVEGTWHDGTVTVTKQGPPRNERTRPDERPPCSPPAGGWAQDGAKLRHPVMQYVQAHPDDFSGAWLGYPLHKPGTPFTSDQYTIEVVTVGVVGDLDTARRELRAVEPENLCLTKAPHSAAELHGAFTTLLKHSTEMSLNVVAIGFNSHVPNLYTVMIKPDFVDEQLWKLIQQVGPDLVDVQPWLHRVS